MDPMRGWNASKMIGDSARAVPTPAVAQVAAKDGSLPLGVGVVLLLIGGVLALFALRNPDLDAAALNRAPISVEGTAAVTVDEAGFYVVYLENDCTQPVVQFTQTGQPTAQSNLSTAGRFPTYSYLDGCAASVGLYAFTAPGTWTAADFGVTTGALAVYQQGHRPTRIDVGTLVVAAAVLVVGGGLTAFALVQRRRWLHGRAELPM